MPVTERLRAAGSWSLNLRPDTPKSILDDLDVATRGFGLLIITPSRIPSTAITAALLRGMSRYVGVYRARPTDYSMQGAHASILLGDEDGKGEILSTVTSQVAASLSTWMTALLPSNGIAKGTVSGGSTLSASYIYMSRRQAIDAVCDGCGADWLVRCNSAGDLVLDASPKATLFGTAAAALATRRALGGKEPGIASFRATQLATAMDVEDYTTKVWLIARGDGGATVGTATAGSVPYFGPGGAAIKMERIIDAPNVDPGNETTIATLQLANFSTLRRAITLSTDEYDISGVVRPGQNIYVYDPVINLYDNTVEQYFRGETIHPLLMRCFGHTWPIRAGFGVYFQTPEASPRIINLSDWVIPEDGDTTVEVGALSRQVGAGVVTLGTPIDNQAGLAVGSVGGIQRVTAATRPTVGLYAGMLIYETDTLELRIYNGSGWVKVGGTGTLPPVCRVYNSAVQSVANSTITAITFDSEREDSLAMHSTVSNTSRLTVPAGWGGMYLIGAQINWAGSSVGFRHTQITINNTNNLIQSVGPNSTSAQNDGVPVTTLNRLAVGDYVEAKVWQNSGGNLNTAAIAGSSPEFWAIWMAP